MKGKTRLTVINKLYYVKGVAKYITGPAVQVLKWGGGGGGGAKGNA